VLVRDARTGAASFTLLLPAKPELATRMPLNCCCMVLVSVPEAVVLNRCSALLGCYKTNSLCNVSQVKVAIDRCMPVQGRSARWGGAQTLQFGGLGSGEFDSCEVSLCFQLFALMLCKLFVKSRSTYSWSPYASHSCSTCSRSSTVQSDELSDAASWSSSRANCSRR
jgi:hypothetical protein